MGTKVGSSLATSVSAVEEKKPEAEAAVAQAKTAKEKSKAKYQELRKQKK